MRRRDARVGEGDLMGTLLRVGHKNAQKAQSRETGARFCGRLKAGLRNVAPHFSILGNCVFVVGVLKCWFGVGWNELIAICGAPLGIVASGDRR